MNKTINKISAICLSLTTAVWLSGAAMILPVYAATAADIETQINALLATIQELKVKLSAIQGTTSVPTITRDLTVGSKGTDVTALQNFLISQSSAQWPSGQAATGYFGSVTKAALGKYQAAVGISPTAGYFGAKSRAYLASLAAGGTGTGTGTGTTGALSVALASGNPAAGNFPAGGSQIPFLKLNVSAGSSDAVVTAMNVYRSGLSSDNDISNVYLIDGSTVLATNLGLSSGKANFSASTGLFTVKAGTSKVITVAADISSLGTLSHTFTFSVNAASDITVSGGATIGGSFPISGNTFAAVSVSNPALATLTVTAIATGGSVNAGTTNYLAGQFSLQGANSAVSVKSIKLTENGTINAGADLANIKLMNGLTQVGATVLSLNADGTVVFDLSTNPLQIASGAIVNLSVYADVVGGVNRNFRLTIQRAYDVVATDMTYNVGASVSATLPVQASLVSISQGTLVIAKSASSPVNYIAAGATNATLSSFNFNASGEAVRITAITYTIGGHSVAQNTVWNNLKLVDDQGVQIGTVITSGTATGTYSAVLTNLNYIIPANTVRVLSVKADIVSTYNANVVGSITSGTAQGYTSLAAIPIGSYTGNTLSASATPFAAALNNAVGAIITVSGASGIKVGSFTLSAGAAEGVNVTSISFTTGAGVATTTQNLVVKYGATQVGATQTTLGNATAYTVSPSSPIAIVTGGQVVIDVYADTISGATSTAAVVVSLTGAQGTGASTNVSRTVTGTTAGQTVTISAAGVLTTALASPAVVSQQVSMGLSSVKLGSFKLLADVNESIDVTSVAVISTSTRAQDIVNLKLMSGTTQYGQTVSGVAAATTTTTFTLTTLLSVPQMSYVVLDVLADINTFGGGASSTDTTIIGLGTVNYQGASSKASASVTAPVASGATLTIYRTSMTPAIGPTFTAPVSLSNGAIVAQFNITAGSANDVILKSISLSQAGSLIQASSSVVLSIYGSDALTTLLASTTVASTTTALFTLNSSIGWTVAKGTTQYLIVKADLASAANLVTTSPSTKSYQISVPAATWNDGITDAIAINPTIITPINGQAINFSF